MPPVPIPLVDAIDRLRALHGGVQPPPARTPFEMILWEQVAYLADDARRLRAFLRLDELVGTDPADIADAPEELLIAAMSVGGIHAAERAERARISARMMHAEFGGDGVAILALPPAKAGKALARFPMIGAPGAEKILLFTGTAPVLALESNGLRVLLRLGYGTDMANYAGAYRSVREDLGDQVRLGTDALIEAHLLLRRHGQDVCKRTRPACGSCPLRDRCAFAASEA